MTQAVFVNARTEYLRAVQVNIPSASAASTATDPGATRYLVQECLDLPAATRRLLNPLWESTGNTFSLAHLNALREALVAYFGECLQMIQRVTATLDSGNPLDLADRGRLREAQRDLENYRDQLLQHWSVFDVHAGPRLREEEARAELLSLNEAFARSAGADQEVWAARVEARRRAKQTS